MKIVINKTFKNIEKWCRALPQIFEQEGELVYQARNTLKKLRLPNGEEVVVKKYAVPIFVNRIAYTFIRESKPCRAYENAVKLLLYGISTPIPVCYIDINSGGLFKQGYFVCMNNPTPNILREFVDGVNNGENILKQFAAFTKDMHDKEVLHLDYSPGNIIYEFDKEGKVIFSLLDLNRMRFNKALSRKERLYNFRRMFRSEESLAIVVKEYARLCGWDEESAVKEAIEYCREFWCRKDRKNEYKRRLRERKNRKS
ncbi:MAG: hypothetical protein IKL50_00915 [Bacteroidales bacterium]|nr:hypothetical protein [Bacteroidales bacterium]